MRCGKRRGLQTNLQLNIIRSISRITQVRERNRVILGTGAGGAEERAKRIKRHHPRADRSSEILSCEGAKGDIFPFLDISGGPVIHEDEAEEVVVGFGHCQRTTEGVGGPAHESTDFELEIQEATGTVDGAFFLFLREGGVVGCVGRCRVS